MMCRAQGIRIGLNGTRVCSWSLMMLSPYRREYKHSQSPKPVDPGRRWDDLRPRAVQNLSKRERAAYSSPASARRAKSSHCWAICRTWVRSSLRDMCSATSRQAAACRLYSAALLFRSAIAGLTLRTACAFTRKSPERPYEVWFGVRTGPPRHARRGSGSPSIADNRGVAVNRRCGPESVIDRRQTRDGKADQFCTDSHSVRLLSFRPSANQRSGRGARIAAFLPGIEALCNQPTSGNSSPTSQMRVHWLSAL